ncbi:Uncharacterised protein [Serratia fonticola]|nr:Uncharacterised protein [Serratia fonticola]CAI1912806.1 Uncharacterised protein [Serratia fonticola]
MLVGGHRLLTGRTVRVGHGKGDIKARHWIALCVLHRQLHGVDVAVVGHGVTRFAGQPVLVDLGRAVVSHEGQVGAAGHAAHLCFHLHTARFITGHRQGGNTVLVGGHRLLTGAAVRVGHGKGDIKARHWIALCILHRQLHEVHIAAVGHGVTRFAGQPVLVDLGRAVVGYEAQVSAAGHAAHVRFHLDAARFIAGHRQRGDTVLVGGYRLLTRAAVRVGYGKGDVKARHWVALCVLHRQLHGVDVGAVG